MSVVKASAAAAAAAHKDIAIERKSEEVTEALISAHQQLYH